MKLRKNWLIRAAVIAIISVSMCGCERDIEYPEGVDSLPSYTTTAGVTVIYDTSATTLPETTTVTTTTPTETTVVTTVETTTVTETETETQTTAETTVTPSETTVTESTSLDIGNVSDVGISEYYENTQTSPSNEDVPALTSSSTAETIESPVEIITETVTSAAVSEITGEEELVTTAKKEEKAAGGVVVKVKYDSAVDVFGTPPEHQLASGRISKYTGREILTHPYSYYTLSEKDKELYDILVDALLKYETVIDFEKLEKTYTFEEVFDIYQLLYNDEYRLFYISPTLEYTTDFEDGHMLSMKLKYAYTKTQTESMRKEIYTEADKILSKISDNMTDYDIVKLFHDSIITSCTYDETSVNPNSIYGALVDKKALCQAYSKTFTYLCSEAGIESFTVLGVANEPHMWNIVKLEDDYYHIDLTWDDPDRAQTPDSVRYDYFGLTDKRIRELRQVDDYEYDVPDANGTKYEYYSYNNLVASSLDEAKEIIIKETVKASETKSSTIQFICSDSAVYDEVTSVLFSVSGDNVITVLDEAKKQSKNLFNTESVYHNSNKNTRTVKIYLTYLD